MIGFHIDPNEAPKAAPKRQKRRLLSQPERLARAHAALELVASQAATLADAQRIARNALWMLMRRGSG
jgi:hypothetical protein